MKLCETVCAVYKTTNVFKQYTVKEHCEAFLMAAQYTDPKNYAEQEGLIEDFELAFVGFMLRVAQK